MVASQQPAPIPEDLKRRYEWLNSKMCKNPDRKIEASHIERIAALESHNAALAMMLADAVAANTRH